MNNELRNQTLVAASVAKQNGFEHTYEALINIIRLMDSAVRDFEPQPTGALLQLR
jgi:hypothetical protein